MKNAKDNFAAAYTKYNGNKETIMKKLNITEGTFCTYKSKYVIKPFNPFYKTETPVGKIKVKVDTTMTSPQLSNFIKDLQKSGKNITLIVK